MAYIGKGIIRGAVTCGAVAGLGLFVSACDRPQPMPTTEQEWQPQQTQPAQPETQERAPVAPAPEREAPAWPTEPGE